jgi:hypothetical protein
MPDPHVLVVFNIIFLGAVAALASLVPAVVVAAAMREGGRRDLPWAELLSWSFYLFLWLAFALYLARPSIFGQEPSIVHRLGFPLAFGGGVLVGWAIIALHPSVRHRVMTMPLHWPIALQTARIIGGAFFVWAVYGQCNWTFATIAGGGDLLVGLTAPFAAIVVAGGGPWSRPVALGHTLFGLADFASAIATAFTVGAGLSWPGPMIPLYLVPLATLMHVWTLVALWRTRAR